MGLGRAAMLLGLLLFSIACTDDSGSSEGWGPLTVGNGESGSSSTALGELEVTTVCAVLQGSGKVWMLVWPPSRTDWEAGEIGFTNPDGTRVSLHDGQRLEVLGTDQGEILAEPSGPACFSDQELWVTEIHAADAP
jgi:hypothetical protein